MRRSNKIIGVVAAGAALALLGSGVAFADNVQNDVETPGDVVTVAQGAAATVAWTIKETSGDTGDVSGDRCNPARTPAVLTPAGYGGGVTLSASSLTYNACDVAQSITFSVAANAAPGDRAVTVSMSNTADYNENPANFTLRVTAAADPCASVSVPAVPTIDFAGGTSGNGGWFTAPPTVSASTTTSGATITYATASNGGTKSGFSSTAPTLGEGVTTVYAKATSATCGKVSGEASEAVSVDSSAPVIADGGPTSAPNAAGWYKSAVTNTFSVSDPTPGSGLLTGQDSPFTASTGTGEGAAVSVPSGTVSDVAGNTASSIDSAAFKIDLTAPTVAVTGVTQGARYTLGSVPAAGCSTSDSLSDVKTSASLAAPQPSGVGSKTVTCSGAEDNAGNTNHASVTYSVVYAWTGFFQPIDSSNTTSSAITADTRWNSAKAGSAIPVKFSLGGDQGLSIFKNGALPTVTKVACPGTTAAIDAIETYDPTATTSGLKYDATAGQYNYTWKTVSTYAGNCYRLNVALADDTTHYAFLKFTK